MRDEPPHDEETEAGTIRAAVTKWIDLYNAADIDVFVNECYREDMFAFAALSHTPDPVGSHGRAALIAFEKRSLAVLPSRRLELVHVHVEPPMAVVEAVLLSDEKPGWSIPFVSIHTYVDGQIAIDRNYGELQRWPK